MEDYMATFWRFSVPLQGLRSHILSHVLGNNSVSHIILPFSGHIDSNVKTETELMKQTGAEALIYN